MGEKDQTIIIYADSRNKTSGIVSSYTFTLPTPLTRIKSFEIIGAEIPFTFPNIWPGNVAVGEITPSGDMTYVFISRNRLAYQMSDSNDILKLFNPTSPRSYTVGLKVNGVLYLVPVNRYVSGVIKGNSYNMYTNADNIAQCIMAIGIAGLTSITTSIAQYKYSFIFTFSAPYTSVEFSLADTTIALASKIGMSQSVKGINPGTDLTCTLSMPSVMVMYDSASLEDVLTDGNLYTSNYTTFKTYRMRFAINGNGYYTFDVYDSGTSINYRGSMTIDPERHYFGWIAGFNGTYTLGPTTAPKKPTYPYKYPKHYEIQMAIYVNLSAGGSLAPKIIIGSGYYTPADLAAAIQTAIRATTALASSTVTFDSKNIISITFGCTSNMSSIDFNVLADPVFDANCSLMRRIGLVEDNQTTRNVSASNSTSCTVTGFKPFAYKPTHLYIGSVALSSLIGSPTVRYVESPLYSSEDIIHKIQINANPGQIINDNLFYGKKHIVEDLTKTISTIDLTLYDEDQQVVYLNGRHWSVTLKITY